MKTGLILVLCFATAAFAADPRAKSVRSPDINPQPEVIKKLGSFTWDIDAQKLHWVVQKGHIANGEFVPTSEEHYEITPDEAIMAAAEEQRGFSEDEAASLKRLLNVLSVYCAESVVWWDEGEGTPIEGSAKSGKSNKKPDTKTPEKKTGDKPVKVDEPRTKPAPKFHVPPGDLVAQNTRSY